MSTDDDLSRAARIRRRGVPPADPSEDELARHWTLSSADFAEIAHCRGPDHRRRFALQLCTLRTYGRFLDDYRQAPLKIVSHLSRAKNHYRSLLATLIAHGTNLGLAAMSQVTTEVLALAAELRKGTIDRIMAMSDLELGMQALLGTLPPRP
jgi:hypothetical protein